MFHNEVILLETLLEDTQGYTSELKNNQVQQGLRSKQLLDFKRKQLMFAQSKEV